jgi:GDP-D-mannose 3',5'-epimerase
MAAMHSLPEEKEGHSKMTQKRILVAGGGGFIGHWLIKRLKADGHWVAGADIKRPEFEGSPADYFHLFDLREYRHCEFVTKGMDEVYQLAANMGGIAWITSHLADVARDNVLINVNMLEAARQNNVKRYLYTSSACVYPKWRQTKTKITPLRETDVSPADPEDGYGWEKLFSEQMAAYYRKDHGLNVRIVRLHNVYGPLGTYDGGREKSPAAICRKVALAKDGDEIEIWGDGKQTRTYLYISDAIEGLVRIMNAGYVHPLNLGTAELVTIDGLVDLVAGIAGKSIQKIHDTSKPEGVRGRSSDNLRLRRAICWEPQVKLVDGLKETYAWIASQVSQRVSA